MSMDNNPLGKGQGYARSNREGQVTQEAITS
jgi:hypothetical protein